MIERAIGFRRDRLSDLRDGVIEQISPDRLMHKLSPSVFASRSAGDDGAMRTIGVLFHIARSDQSS